MRDEEKRILGNFRAPRPWSPKYGRPRAGAWAVDCGESFYRCFGRCLTHSAPTPNVIHAMVGWGRAVAMRRLGLPR